MMKVQDRGAKKWVSLMLPEHKEYLQNIFVKKEKRPQLDEQQMQMIDLKLKYSLNENVNLLITLYDDGSYRTVQGRLTEINQLRGYIVLRSECGFTISLSNIVDVEIC